MSNDTTSDSDSVSESKAERAESVRQMLSGEEAPKEVVQPGDVPTPDDAHEPPAGTGQSITRRGEGVVKEEGKEPGRFDSGSDGTPADRPTGGSTARDTTSVDPQDPTTDSPPQGGQGGH